MMRKLIFILAILFAGSFTEAVAQMVTREEAAMLASRYTRYFIDKYGHWSDSNYAIPGPVKDLFHKGRHIGYYCNVDPSGFLVMSLRRELEPVKASAQQGIFNPDDSAGLVDLIKGRMLKIIQALEANFGPLDQMTTFQIEGLTEIDYKSNWEELAAYSPGSPVIPPITGINYTEGEILMQLAWHQDEPYNNFCPYLVCSENANGRAKVGCVATAGAQIMRYWNWPPYLPADPSSSYDWKNMKCRVNTADPIEQQNAVAALSRDVGLEVGMDYGCASSSAYTEDMEAVFEYNDYDYACCKLDRDDYDASVWFALVQEQININRPIQYRIDGHSIVCDGWLSNYAGNSYHMNYGWGWPSSSTTWYAVDCLYLGDPENEYMLTNIVPQCATGSSLGALYFIGGYHYIDMDCSSANTLMCAGSIIQTLPGAVVKGTGTGSYLKIMGSSTNGEYSLVYTNGDRYTGIKILNGAMRMSHNGSFSLHKPEDSTPWY